MTATWQPAAELLISDLRDVFGNRLKAVVAYGPVLDGATEAPLSCLVLVTSLTVEDLRSCASCVDKWERHELAAPLVVPEQEFGRSLDTFPLEYGEIIRTHERVYGEDPFASVTVVQDDLRRACELQARSHLLHLREAFIQSGGGPAAVANLVTDSAPAFVSLLRSVARLNGFFMTDRHESALAGAQVVGLSQRLVVRMLDLERRSARIVEPDLGQWFPEYLAAVEHVSRTIDQWRT